MRMAPDSNTAKPSSTMAGMRPLGLMRRNSGLFCFCLSKDSTCTRYGRPSSSRAMDTLCPFGVAAVYRSIMAISDAMRTASAVAGAASSATEEWIETVCDQLCASLVVEVQVMAAGQDVGLERRALEQALEARLDVHLSALGEHQAGRALHGAHEVLDM